MSNKKRLPPKEYHDLIQQVFERDGWKCKICRYRDTLQAHHVIFRSKGGEDIKSNLITVCAACHEDIHSGSIKILQLIDNDDGIVVCDIVKSAGWIPSHIVR